MCPVVGRRFSPVVKFPSPGYFLEALSSYMYTRVLIFLSYSSLDSLVSYIPLFLCLRWTVRGTKRLAVSLSSSRSLSLFLVSLVPVDTVFYLLTQLKKQSVGLSVAREARRLSSVPNEAVRDAARSPRLTKRIVDQHQQCLYVGDMSSASKKDGERTKSNETEWVNVSLPCLLAWLTVREKEGRPKTHDMLGRRTNGGASQASGRNVQRGVGARFWRSASMVQPVIPCGSTFTSGTLTKVTNRTDVSRIRIPN